MSDPAGNSDPALRPTKVLVVEDEVLVRMALANALRAAGYVAIEACSGAEALDVVESGVAPDVLLTDVVMPGHVDGLELAALLERLLPDLIVFIMSGRLLPDDLRLRVNFVSKPSDARTVVDRIAQVAPPTRRRSAGDEG